MLSLKFPYAGNLHVRFDEGAGVPDNKGRPALLYTLLPNHASLRSGFASLSLFYLVGALAIAVARVFFLEREYVKR